MKNKTNRLVIMSICIGINVIGSLIALSLKLPIFLDTIGTFMVAFLFGPIAGIITGALTYITTSLTFDPIAIYFVPSQIVVGLLGGILYKRGYFKKNTTITISTFIISTCSAFVAAIAAAYVFGGITSSGTSIIVMILTNLGVGLVPSVFITQIITEFIDKMIIVIIALNGIKLIRKKVLL